VEVLLLTDPVDEVWVDAVPSFEGKELRSIAKGEVELGTEEEKKEAETAREQRQEEYAGLLEWLKGELAEQVKDVRLSSRLTSSPACVVSDTHDATPALENLYRAMGQELPPVKRILELNPDHALVAGLRTAHAERPDDPALKESAELLHGMALLAEGGELADPARFVRLVADRLEHTL
jgi:molecular chaperone HtpG